MEIVENKYAILNAEQYLLRNMSKAKEIPLENTEFHETRKATPTKFILPLEDMNHVEEQQSEANTREEYLQREVSLLF